MSPTSYASTLIKENDLKNKHNYKRQAEQAARARNAARHQSESTQAISVHSEDCPIGEAEKDIIIGKILEGRAKQISIVAQEICDIQEERQKELHNSRVNDKEQCKQQSLNLKEIEDRERELKDIQEEIINILKNRNQERLLKKLKKKDNNGNKKGDHVNNNNDEDSESNDSYPKVEDGTNDVENEISFIEKLVEEDMIGESIDYALNRLSGSVEDNEGMNLESNSEQQEIEHELETEYFEMQKLLEDIEKVFE